MLRGGVFSIGRVAGIPLKIHYSWFIVFTLVTSMLALQWYPQQLEHHPASVHVILALVSALLLFGSVYLHELGHALVARAFGVPVRGIILFVFGGIAEMVGEPKRPLQEVAVAAAGPAVSLTIASLCGLGYALSVEGGMAHAMSVQLGVVNLGLFMFNMIPAFPLDGGRIARATLWGLLGHYRRATFVATAMGVGFAGLMAAAGITLLAQRGLVGGLWLIFIGLFVGRAALQSYRRARLTDALRAGLVAEVMTPSIACMDPGLTLAQAEDARPGCFEDGVAIGSGEDAAGWVDATLIDGIPRHAWGTVRLGDIMAEADSLAVVAATDPLEALFRVFATGRAPAARVMDDGRWVGMAGRGALLAYFRRLQGEAS